MSPSRLPSSHYLFWMEGVIEDLLGLDDPRHSKEHDEMMDHWRIKFKNIMPLNGPQLEDGSFKVDREHHLKLHLKYWKETGMQDRLQYVERFEKESGYNLDDLTLPSPKSQGEAFDY